MVRITLVTNNPRKVVLAEETDSIKAVLEKNDVNYGNAAVALDGATLGAGEINKTLKDLGVTEKAIVSVLAHKDNAAKAKISGAACVITSEMTAEQIKRYKKFHPEALIMYDEDGDPIFGISIDEDGPGSINSNGAVFGATTDNDGHAQITVVLNPTAEDTAELVYEELGRPIMYLNEMEEELLNGIEELDKEEAAIKAAIVKE